jgi:Cytochrome c554 and c-prime
MVMPCQNTCNSSYANSLNFLSIYADYNGYSTLGMPCAYFKESKLSLNEDPRTVSSQNSSEFHPFLILFCFVFAGTVISYFCLFEHVSGEEFGTDSARYTLVNHHEQAQISQDKKEVTEYAVDQAHSQCFENDPFPSAAKCAKCHPQHYREWSVSPHAYAQLSPVFNAMSNRLIQLNNGTLGDFCIRCHTPVGMALNEPINISNLDRPASSREGVTCVNCHRINQAWGKGSGRQALVPGDITQAVYGPIGSSVLSEVLSQPDKYGVLKTNSDPSIRGRKVHQNSHRFFQLTTSGFCGSCHDVFAPNGFRLEDAFSEYKQSPSSLIDQHSCQDCHMGAVPGQAKGYTHSPAAKVGNVFTAERKHTNHMMVGPDYSIIHRGIFPHNPKAVREDCSYAKDEGLATMREWLYFDDAAGWGTASFEKNIPEGTQFQSPWDDQIMRIKARRILKEQYKLLAEATTQRLQLLRAGYSLGGIEVKKASRKGIRFSIPVCNVTRGHGVPTGFDAERVVFLRTMAWDQNGKLVFQSGDLDPNGDVRDSHSAYVHNGKIPLDRQLMSLQTRFVTRNIRGGEREQVVPVPYSVDPLPFMRPLTRPFTVIGRPTGARKHKQNIEVNGQRVGNYHISKKQLNGPGNYHVRVQLISGMVPVNLIHIIAPAGFDYGMSAKNVADGIVDGHMVIHEQQTTIFVK